MLAPVLRLRYFIEDVTVLRFPYDKSLNLELWRSPHVRGNMAFLEIPRHLRKFKN